MITRPQFFTDFFDEERDLKYSKQLTEMVTGTQIVGLILIGVGVFSLEKLPDFQKTLSIWMLILGFSTLIAFWTYCWFDGISHAVEFIEWIEWRPTPLHEAQRKTRILRGTLLLILIDTLILATLITVTGGPGYSPLDPLLPIIPIIAMILQQPKRTVYVALGSGLSVIALFLGHQLLHMLRISHSHFPQGWQYDGHSDPAYPMAFGIVTIGAVGLTIFEFLISHKIPSLRKGVKAIVDPLLLTHSDAKAITTSVRRGTKSWTRWLEHRGLPTADLSLVHGEHELIRQAVVLSIPHWFQLSDWSKWRLRRLTRRVTFLTLAAHWIDDHFDSLGVHCENPALRNETLLASPPQLVRDLKVARKFHRLNELLRGMKTIVQKDHRLQVENAVIRIIYGGFIQNAKNPEHLQALLNEYIKFVSEGISPKLVDIYKHTLQSDRPVTVWITTKVVMELLDCCSPSFSRDRAEFLNLLYGPILYYQDWDSEVLKETFGGAFGKSPDEIKERLPTPDDLLSLLEQCWSVMPSIFGGGLPYSRKQQLRMLLDIYEKPLPEELRTSYARFLTS